MHKNEPKSATPPPMRTQDHSKQGHLDGEEIMVKIVKRSKKVKYHLGITSASGVNHNKDKLEPTTSLSNITNNRANGIAFSGFIYKNDKKEEKNNSLNCYDCEMYKTYDKECENVDSFPLKSDLTSKDCFQDSVENEFELDQEYYEYNDNSGKNYKKTNIKVENNIFSSLEFIWSEIRNENVLERKQSFEYLEANNDCVYIRNRIPKNVLDQVSKVPKRLESLISFSMLLCLDTILYDLTFLPINSTIAFAKIVLLFIIKIKEAIIETIIKVRFYVLISLNVNYRKNETRNVNRNNIKKIHSWDLFSGEKNGEFNAINENKSSNETDAVSNYGNASVEYIIEERNSKSKSMLNLSEITNECRDKIIAENKSMDDGILSSNNNFLPQIRNYVNSFRISDQKSSFEESELICSCNKTPCSNLCSIDDNYPSCDSELSNLRVENDNNKRLKLSVIELTDVSRFVVLLFSIFIFSMFDISFFYHYIRGQGLLKLYVIFNMLEVFEKLFRSFGRDLIDTFLKSTINYFSYIDFLNNYPSDSINEKSDGEVPTFKSIFTLYTVVICYLLIHCIIHMIRGLALNISLNSSEYTMFLIVITNNFAEIKSTVFKTYHSISLFTVACSDSIERFQLLYDGCILFLRMYFNTRLYNNSIFITVITWIVSVFIVEIIVDWFKHSFLVKFNKINSKCYESYLETLIGDVLLSRGSNIALYYLLENKCESEREGSGINNNVELRDNQCQKKTDSYNNDQNSILRQNTSSISRGNTMGLEIDVSSIFSMEESKLKKRKSDLTKQYLNNREITFVSKELRNIYAFPYIVSRRIGFVSLPLTILLICVLLFSRLHSTLCINHMIIIWFILFIIKYLSSILIVSFSQNNIERLKNWNPDFNKINAL